MFTMKSVRRLLPFTFLMAFLSHDVMAEWYVGGTYTVGILEVPGSTFKEPAPVPQPPGYTEPVHNVFLDTLGTEDFTPSLVIIKGGYDLLEYLAVEARIGVGLTKGERSSFDVSREVDIKSLYGAFAKLQSGWSDVNLYLLLGYTTSSVDISSTNVSRSEDFDGASYGIGADFSLSGDSYFNLEYMQYYDADNITAVGLGAGLTVRF